MLYRMAAGEPTSDEMWADVPFAWVKENALAADIGFTAGGSVTRVQIATMMMRFCELTDAFA